MHKTRRLLTATFAGVVLLSACGSDDDSSTPTDAPAAETTEAPPAAEPEPATTDEMADDEMADDEMADDEPAPTDEMADEEMADDGTGILVDELTAAGLTGDQANCVVDAAVGEWGADALLAAGSATDAQLVRLAEITFDCAT